MELEQALGAFLATVKLPKSAAFASVAMVMKSIMSLAVGKLPANNPRIDYEHPAFCRLATVISPKSNAFPVEEIVT